MLPEMNAWRDRILELERGEDQRARAAADDLDVELAHLLEACNA